MSEKLFNELRAKIRDLSQTEIGDGNTLCIMLKVGDNVSICNNGKGQSLLLLYCEAIAKLAKAIADDFEESAGHPIEYDVVEGVVTEMLATCLHQEFWEKK